MENLVNVSEVLISYISQTTLAVLLGLLLISLILFYWKFKTGLDIEID